MVKLRFLFAFLLAAGSLSACAGLLPAGHDIARAPWNSFDEAKGAFDKVVPQKTTTRQLKGYGFDIYSTPNVRILNYLDIAVATQTIKKEDLSTGLQLCLSARANCRAYEFAPQVINSKRYGNFWLDMLNFKRKTRDVGWQFKALFIIVDDVVVEKLWSGNRKIDNDRETRNPLGPLQDVGGMVLRLVP